MWGGVLWVECCGGGVGGGLGCGVGWGMRGLVVVGCVVGWRVMGGWVGVVGVLGGFFVSCGVVVCCSVCLWFIFGVENVGMWG